ncbi:MAG: hypothetical protein IPG30_05325 [Chitinophagaceae bacterium]|nr:hypothetical protein [Chitinophagaceae bacterium]
MQNKYYTIALIFAILIAASSCSSKIISTNYYTLHQKELMHIETIYKYLYQQKPFSIAFTSKNLQIVSVEMKTDSLNYIYEFNTIDARLKDSLLKYGYDAEKVIWLINAMQKIECTWINNYDYYTNNKEQRLIFISIKPKVIRRPFSPSKYYMLAYFDEPQHSDENGLLLDGSNTKRLRRFNYLLFKKITDKICYTVSEKFR